MIDIDFENEFGRFEPQPEDIYEDTNEEDDDED